MWEIWKRSEVYNWTVEDTVHWLIDYVDLPQYQSIFLDNKLNGTQLPRMASEPGFLSRKLGITDLRHRQKLHLKAQDVVLFGAPKGMI